ncbi:MAG: hypothetical protein PVG87_06960 [Desulfobacteraceae bacterium]|jgi:hypothetical protein
MRTYKYALIWLSILALLAANFWSCAPSNLLRVHYQLPTKSDSLAGKQILLTYTDAREQKTILSKSAQEDLRDFSGSFTLVVVQDSGDEKLLGAYDLSALLKEAFKQRIHQSGLQVTEKIQLKHQIEFVLNRFVLDLEARKWILTMSYQTILKESGDLVLSESISGTAERVKMVGSRDAEKLISELISDTINKVDITKLFQKAGW